MHAEGTKELSQQATARRQAKAKAKAKANAQAATGPGPATAVGVSVEEQQGDDQALVPPSAHVPEEAAHTLPDAAHSEPPAQVVAQSLVQQGQCAGIVEEQQEDGQALDSPSAHVPQEAAQTLPGAGNSEQPAQVVSQSSGHQCPYTGNEAPSKQQPLLCKYSHNCKYHTTSWGHLLKHVTGKQKWGGHGISATELKAMGHAAYVKGQPERRDAEAQRRRGRAKGKATSNTTPSAGAPRTGQEAAAQIDDMLSQMDNEAGEPGPSEAVTASASAPPGGNPHQGQVVQQRGRKRKATEAEFIAPTQVMVKLCYVRCSLYGEPIEPFTCLGLAQQADLCNLDEEEVAQTSATAHASPLADEHAEDDYEQPPPLVTLADELAEDEDDQPPPLVHLAPDDEHLPTAYELELAAALPPTPATTHQDALAPPTAPQAVPTLGVGAELANQLSSIASKLEKIEKATVVDPKEHLEGIPHLVLKEKYKVEPAPKAKGEYQCGRASWPPHLKRDVVHLPEFWRWLADERNKKGSNLHRKYQAVCRFLGMLTYGPGAQPKPCPDKTSLEALLGVQIHNVHKESWKIPLMALKFDWVDEFMEGLVLYADYHLEQFAQHIEFGVPGHWKQYQTILENFKKSLKGGHWRRCQDEKAKRHNKKQREDLRRYQKFAPKEVRQEAVFASYLVTKAIHKRWRGEGVPPRKVWARLNSECVGPLYNVTHGGRCHEYEIAEKDYLGGKVRERSTYMECPIHKVWRSYGDLAKYLPPPLLEQWALYDELERPADCTTFFVPGRPGAPHMSLPSALRSWTKHRIDKKYTQATVNDYRKYDHVELIKLTKNEEKCKEVLAKIDAHGKAVMEKHYLLRSPEDDARLAKLVAEQVHGDLARFPTDEDLEEAMGKGDELAQLLREIIGGQTDPGLEEEEPSDEFGADEEEMSWWKFGAFFGLHDPGQLTIGGDTEQQQLPLQDAPPVGSSAASSSAGPQTVVAQPADTTVAASSPTGPQGLFGTASSAQGLKRQSPPENEGEPPSHRPPAKHKSNRSSTGLKQFMQCMLAEWQREHKQSQSAMPALMPWFTALRDKCINEAGMSPTTCEDVCKSYLAGYLRDNFGKVDRIKKW